MYFYICEIRLALIAHMNRYVLFLVAALTAVLSDLKAQDPQFTQFYANPLYLNPAFAGTARCPRIALNYRNQWPNVTGRYVTQSFSGDAHFDALAGGAGILITNDDQAYGTLKTINASFLYSYQAVISREFSLKFGIQATYLQKSLDRSNLTYGDMIDARRGFVWNTNEPMPSNRKSNADFSVGMLGFSKRYFFGFAAHHINRPDEGLLGESRLPTKLTAHGGIIFPLEKGNESYISPNVLFQAQQKFRQLNLGLYYVKGPIVAGLWYRTNDAVIALVGLQNKNFKFGYSYDVTVTDLAGRTAGAHEISVQMQLECKTKRKKYRTISCPSF
jgi:type IX secretion system PorP/SprF family membrane protein